MRKFRTELRTKIHEFLSNRLSKIDTESEEIWAEADGRTAFQDSIRQYHNSNNDRRPKDRSR
jgi:hypothetical protein